jgi:alkanesulfonate monooxygenase SsuD/methylene tetrahydromethanopterin reductase-like flavin-dependent oxidoreductase (luciferase family)
MVSQAQRLAFRSGNKLKLGLFGANCSSGRAVTRVPERWLATWPEVLDLARTADEAGLEFMLPIGRWKGYGGDTDYQGSTFETVTWATALLASTKRISVFGTVHAPLIHPVTAAKQFVTADHVGGGRFGLNVVCGWNEGEFEMFGARQRDHEARYAYAREWLDVIKSIWTRDDEFDFEGQYLQLKGVRANPKPFGGSRPLIMNAGASPVGQAFAVDNCDALFRAVHLAKLGETRDQVAAVKARAAALGRDLGVYTIGVMTCRPSRREAQDYYEYCTFEHADWSAVDRIMAMQKVDPAQYTEAEFQRLRREFANGLSGFTLIGDPDDVAGQLAQLHEAGFSGIALSMVNYGAELPYFRDEVLPRLERLGLREPVRD